MSPTPREGPNIIIVQNTLSYHFFTLLEGYSQILENTAITIIEGGIYMETNINTENQSEIMQPPIIPEQKKPKTLIYAIIGIIALNIVFVAYTLSALNNIVNQTNSSISNLESKVLSLETKLTSVNLGLVESENRIIWLSLNSRVSEGVVTDQLVVQRATFEDGIICLDIRSQPSFSSHFLGQGRFDLQDRELKAIILTLINETKSYYDNYVQNVDMPSFDKYKVYITQNNYEVATYSSGELLLTGEK